MQLELDGVVFDHFDAIRASIEIMYGRHKTMFPLFAGNKRLKLKAGGAADVSCLIMYSFFVMNCYTCLNGSACTGMFDILPPTINEYLPLDEIPDPGPIVALVEEN